MPGEMAADAGHTAVDETKEWWSLLWMQYWLICILGLNSSIEIFGFLLDTKRLMTADASDFADVQSLQRKCAGFAAASPDAVMWSETIGLRTRLVSDQKKSVLVLVLQVCCCVAKHGLVIRSSS